MNFHRTRILGALFLGTAIAIISAPLPAHAVLPMILLRGAAAREAAAVATVTRSAPAVAVVARSTATAEAAAARPAFSASRGAVGNQAVRAAGAGRTGALGPRAVGRPTDVVVSRQRHPAAAEHITHAQRHGQPSILTLDRTGASARRAESLRYINNRARRPGTGFDRDEYPPAMFKEGGNTANVRYINRHDNRGSGKSIERQLRNVPDGARARLLVTE